MSRALPAEAVLRAPLGSRLMRYIWIGATTARSNMAYPGEVAARVLFLGVILYIFLQLWRVTYAGTGSVRLGGFTLPQMLWYLAMTEAIALSTPRVAGEVDQDVRAGTVALYLIRPLSYPLYRLSSTLGERSVRFLMNVVVGGAVALFFVGPLGFTPGGLLIFAVSLPLAFVLDFLANFTIGLGAFWLEDTSGIELIYSRMNMVLGGMLIPMELFPRSVQPVVRALPFSSVVYGPARLLVHPGVGLLGNLLLHQVAAIAVLALMVSLVYRAALRRISSHGG